jgi:hypothetical protein
MRELIAQREKNRLKKLALVLCILICSVDRAERNLQSSRGSRIATQSTRPEGEDDEMIHSSSTLVADGTDPRNMESMDVVMQGPITPGLYPFTAIRFDGSQWHAENTFL